MIKRRFYFVISIPVFALLYTYTALAVFFVLIFSYMHWKPGAFGVIGIWAKTIFPMMGKRLRVTGKERFDKKKKYILLANHASMFDIIAIMAFFPRVSWFGAAKLLKIPLFGKMLLMMDYIPMTMANIRNTRRMVEQLVEKSSSRTIAIFPEGTRTQNGKLNPFFRGFIYLLKASETDILPVTLNGFFKLKPKTRFSINFGAKLEVIIHEPIDGKSLSALEDKIIIDRVRSVIESASREI